MTREEAEKISAELVAQGMAEADAYIAAASAMLAALKDLHREANMAGGSLPTVAKALKAARIAIDAAEAAGIKES